MNITQTITIDAPAAKAFDFIANYGNDAQWRGGLTEMTQSKPGVAVVGSTAHEALRNMGQIYVTDTVVTELLPEKRTAWRGTKSAFPVTGWREVKSVGNRSQITYNLNTEFSGVMKLMEPFIRNSFEKRVAGDLARLKQVLEG